MFRLFGAVLASVSVVGVALWLIRREFAYFRATVSLPWTPVGDHARLTAPLATPRHDLTGGWRMDIRAAMERRAQTLMGGASHACDDVAQPKPGYVAWHAKLDTGQFDAVLASWVQHDAVRELARA